MNLGQSVEGMLGAERQRTLARSLSLADVNVEPGQFVLRVAVTSVLLGILGLVRQPILGLVLLVVPYLVARTWVGHKAGKRQAAFAEQLPDFLRSLVMSLRSGFGLSQAMESAAQGSSGTASALRSSGSRLRSAWVAVCPSAMRLVGSTHEERRSGVGRRCHRHQPGDGRQPVRHPGHGERHASGSASASSARSTPSPPRAACRPRSSPLLPFLFALLAVAGTPGWVLGSVLRRRAYSCFSEARALMVMGWFWIRRVVTIKI